MLSETLARHDPAVLDALPLADGEQEIPEAVEIPTIPVNERSILGLAELLLKAPAQLDAWTRDPARQGELIPRLPWDWPIPPAWWRRQVFVCRRSISSVCSPAYASPCCK